MIRRIDHPRLPAGLAVACLAGFLAVTTAARAADEATPATTEKSTSAASTEASTAGESTPPASAEAPPTVTATTSAAVATPPTATATTSTATATTPAASASSPAPSASDPAPPAGDLTYSREKYYYAATGLRDPFGSLVSGRFVSDDAKRLPDVGSISLLGVMWGENDKFGLVEDQEGNGFVLRVGDPVVNGEVAGITRESLSVRQHFFGTSTTITLKLKPREEKGHAKNKR